MAAPVRAQLRQRPQGPAKCPDGLRRDPALVSVAVLLAAGLLPCSQAWGQPAPRVSSTALPSGNSQKSGTPIIYTPAAKNAATGLTTATITQFDASNIVDWKSFDIGTAARLNIVQPSASSVLLNKVSGGEFQNQTVIDGVLNANGRVYLYNPSGIVFGKTGTVNVNTLIASSLKFDENRVMLGLLQPGAAPVLSADPALGRVPGAVLVDGDAQGRAALNAAIGGLILLAAPQVTNNGKLSAPDGQVMLAAGTKVYLAAPQVTDTGTSLRGLLVEVSNDDLASLPAVGARTVENGASGSISVAHGNATMIGYAVNQKGRVSASTSVNLNGSVYLLARDQASRGNDTSAYHAGRTGALVLGPGSGVEVRPDSADPATITAATVFNKSEVKLVGANIALQAGASIVAPGGNVAITARLIDRDGVTVQVLDPRSEPVRVELAAGSLIDVSGSQGAHLAMASNVITVDLRGTELADNPVLRDSALYASKVQIDIRKGTSAANVSGWLGLVGQGIGAVNAAGGKVSISADSAIIQRAGSKIAVDGGYVDYLSGYVNTSKLQLGNKLIDIGSAVAGTLYGAVVKLPDSPANFEAGYRQGSSAGSVQFSAPILVLQGGLSGQAQAGARQRDITAAGFPLGGQLEIGAVSGATVNPNSGKVNAGASDQFGFMGKLEINGQTTQSTHSTQTAVPPVVGAAFDLGKIDQRLLASQLDLDTVALAQAGFSRLVGVTMGNVEVAASVTLAPGGRLWLGAASSAQGTLSLPGGNLSLNASVSIPGGSVALVAAATLQVADGVALNLAGRWTNDRSSAAAAVDAAGVPTTPLVLKGGAIGLWANQLLIGNGFGADVGAGAAMNSQGTLRQGGAGSITLQAVAQSLDSAPELGLLRLGRGATLTGYGFGAGGTLSLTGRNVVLGEALVGASADDLSLAPAFFQQGGFSSYDITANVNLSVGANSLIQPRAQSWQMAGAAADARSGQMASAAVPVWLALADATRVRPATNLTLRAPAQKLGSAGRVLVDAGAQLRLDPGASLSLLAGRQLTVLGTLDAPAGAILLGLTADSSAPLFTERSIWLGANSRLLADGSSKRLYTDGVGVSRGELLAGGSIRLGNLQQGLLGAAPGYVVAQTGALLSVNGIGMTGLSFKSGAGVGAAQAVASAGGSIEIRAREGLLFDATLAGGSGGSGSAGGSLTVALEGVNFAGNTDLLTLATKAPTSGVVPAGLQPNQPIVNAASRGGQGWLLARSFAAGGFGRLSFKSKDTLSFDLGAAALSLSAVDSLVLDAPNLLADLHTGLTVGLPAGAPATGFALNLSSAYVQLGSADYQYQVATGAVGGSSSLNVTATTIDLIGNSALQGFSKVKLAAAGDIRLVGINVVDTNGAATAYARGSLAMVGDLTLVDAQTYPTTLSDFKLAVAGIAGQPASGALTFAANPNAIPAYTVLSAGGSLTALAPHIVQAGRVVAPFGSITLGNLDKTVDPIVTADLAYRAGSVTSVVGVGVVPLGSVVNGSVPTASAWQAALSDGTAVQLTQLPVAGTATPERALPAKAIISRAIAINADRDSVLDLSGGGSLYAFGFTPGRGGSRDVLDSTTAFAINPNFLNPVAPIDGAYGNGGLKAGDSVQLSAMPGLAAGIYTLLPAHYALLPGGFSISVAANARDMPASANATRADGSLLVSGRLAQSGGAQVASRSQGFVVASGSVVRTQSEFDPFDAGSYFKAKAVVAGKQAGELPADGGHLVFEALGSGPTALAFGQRIFLTPASGGRAGSADISAGSIEIVAVTGGGSGSGVKLVVADLNALGADSLVVGAAREAGNTGLRLKVGAATVSLDTDAQHPLIGADIVLAASNKVSVGPGAVLRADAVLAREPQDLALNGSGALLRASSGGAVVVQRSAAAADGGVLDIAAGALISASGSTYLDASSRLTQNGSLRLGVAGQGGALGYSTPDISLGTAFPPALIAANGLLLGKEALAGLGTLAQLSFNSYGKAIGLYGSFDLGSAALQSLSLSGAGLVGHGGDVRVLADTLRIDGAAASATAAATATATATAAAGSLTVQAGSIEVGSQRFAIQGVAGVAMTAQRQVTAVGSAATLSTDQNLWLTAGRISTANGSDATFSAGGAMYLASVSAAGFMPAGLGGALRFAAASITSDALLSAPAGQIVLDAGQGLLDIRGGQVSVAGVGVGFGSTMAYAPGGAITLQGGQVSLGAAALLDVSATGAAAGSLRVVSAGPAQLDGMLKAGATAGGDGAMPLQGQFVLASANAGAAGEFGSLNRKLNDAGFAEAREFRFAAGDVVLAGQDSVLAHHLTIAVDNGNIRVGGNSVINASGGTGGSIALYAAQTGSDGSAGQITLSDNASLNASSTAASTAAAGAVGRGGTVLLASANLDGSAAASVDRGASLHLEGGRINVAGSALRNGTVTLRAPQLGDSSDVAVARLDTLIVGSASAVIEAVKVYQASTITQAPDTGSNLDASSGGQMYRDASAFSTRQATILARLKTPPAAVSLRAGIEVRSLATDPTGGLRVAVNEFAANAADRGWNLADWRFAGQPVALTLRAAGDLNILGSISDGFVKPTTSALSMPDWALGSGASAALRLVGGADLAAANPLSVNSGGGGSGDVHLGFAARSPTSAAPVTSTDAPVALVRTGTGSIDIAAGRDLTLDMAKVYTVATGTLDLLGTPLVYDQKFVGGVGHSDTASYQVSVFGATLYTAGAAGATDPAALDAAPKNALNSHYGAAPNTLSRADFGRGGGAITIVAGRDVNGPHALGADWYYRNQGSSAQYAQKTDPATGAQVDDLTKLIAPAVAGTVVLLPRTASPLVNNWLFRQGRSQLDGSGQPVFETLADGTLLSTAWWSRPDYFNQGVATLAGGDLSVSAARNIIDLSASVATNARVIAAAGTLLEQGGGDLRVTAGANLMGGAFYVQKGAATLRAAGSISAGPAAAFRDLDNDPANPVTAVAPLNPLLALGNGRFAVTAGLNLAIAATYNPMLTEQSAANVPVGDSQFAPVFGDRWDTAKLAAMSADDRSARQTYLKKYAQFSNFSTYGDRSALQLTALGGDLLLVNDARAVAANKTALEQFEDGVRSSGVPDQLGQSFRAFYLLAPATLKAAALTGDLVSANGFSLIARSDGQLDLLAAANVSLSNGQAGAIRMLDASPAGMSSVSSPRVLTQNNLDVMAGNVNGVSAHTLGGLHLGDAEPARVIALTGDIVGDASAVVTLALPKAAQISAGRDIVDLGLNIQQLKPSDSTTNLTTIRAGRDFVDSTSAGSDPSKVAHVITGPGQVTLIAGRHVDLGNGSGLVTRGNLDNPYLSEGGASLQVIAGGTVPDYASFVAFARQYGSAYDVVAKDDVAALMAFVAQRDPRLAAGTSVERAWQALRSLPRADQADFLARHPAVSSQLASSDAALSQALARGDTELLKSRFFAGLVETARLGQKDASNQVIDSSLAVFDRLIASLLPTATRSAGGDISAFASQFKTEQGGAIDLLAPAGSVYAGLTQGVSNKQPYEQGIFTIRGGAVRALVKTDFLVNQGRVFTLGGGDIALVSQRANIDAGRGAKTASSAPPPLITIDANGNIKVDVSGSISGSGIATLKTRTDQLDSNVAAVAPRGIFDAGDAGVRSTGSVQVVAPVVLNGANISAGGSVAGAQVAVAAPALGSVAAPASAATKSDDAAKAASSPGASSADAPLDVDALGHGSAVLPTGDAATDDASDDDLKKKKKR